LGDNGAVSGAKLGESRMLDNIRDLFQWNRFITPYVVQFAYALAVILIVLNGLSGIVAAFVEAASRPLSGLLALLVSLIAMLAEIVFARIAAEFVLVTFRINDHLGALRNRAGG
jgi:hypothetical protein